MHRREGQRLKLIPIQGPPLAPIQAEPGGLLVLGRSAACDVQLPDPAVSRRHASVSCPGGVWMLTDLGSRGGVLLNAMALGLEDPTPIADHDLISIGPWVFRARTGISSGSSLHTVAISADRLDPGERVDPVSPRELRSLARRRLDLLIECAGSINAAADELALAVAVIQAVREGTGFPRAAVFRLAGEEVEVLAEAGEPGDRGGAFSRTLIDTAAAGQVARLSHDAPVVHGESIARLGIQAALCAPIMIGAAVEAFLYLDDRRHNADVQPDAAAFCQAVCRIGGLALANQRRSALERANAEIMRDVGAAAEAQRLLMPAPDGACHGVRYSVRMKPGRFVAGDLFNILPLEGGRVGVYLGDVAGKGVGAAILMATTQSMLNAALRTTGSPAAALRAVGPEIATMLPGGRFISLWVAVIEPAGRRVSFVDAGHGHWLVRRSADAPPTTLVTAGGLPLGVDPDRAYTDETVQLGPEGRIILHSDGVTEQRSRTGEEFGLGRVIETLTGCAGPRDDVEQLFAAVRAHAGVDTLDDDVTIASIEWAQTG